MRACREYAAGKEITVLEVYADEAVSGKGSKTASRKAYQRMLRDVDRGTFDTVLIHKYDRVARNLGEHVNLEKRLKDKRVELIAVAQDFGNSNEAKIMRTLMWSLSEYYIDNLAAEVKKGMRETALKGLHNGGYAPFGYDAVNRQYVVNELEAGYVRKIFNAAALRNYQDGEQDRAADFNHALQRRIREKQGEYDTLMKNLSTGALPAEVVADIGEQMQTIKAEIVQLQGATPPADFTVEQIKAWLEVLKASADEKAVHLLIERIDVEQKEPKTDFNMQSTLKSVLGEIGCGGRI